VIGVRTLTVNNIGSGNLILNGVSDNVTWLTPTLGSTTVLPASSTLVTLTFNTAGLTAGQSYPAQVSINSNDPVNPIATVNVTLTIANYKVYLPVVMKNR
jgi:hypothetical protein